MVMEREYLWARRIIVILMVILTIAFFGGFEMEIDDLLLASVITAGIVWLACFLCTGISRKMIQLGDKISNGFLRGIYYFVLFPLVLALGIGLVWFIEFVEYVESQSYNYEQSMGASIFVFFLSIACVVLVLIPYVQSLIVLLMRKVLKKKDEEEEGQEKISE